MTLLEPFKISIDCVHNASAWTPPQRIFGTLGGHLVLPCIPYFFIHLQFWLFPPFSCSITNYGRNLQGVMIARSRIESTTIYKVRLCIYKATVELHSVLYMKITPDLCSIMNSKFPIKPRLLRKNIYYRIQPHPWGWPT